MAYTGIVENLIMAAFNKDYEGFMADLDVKERFQSAYLSSISNKKTGKQDDEDSEKPIKRVPINKKSLGIKKIDRDSKNIQKAPLVPQFNSFK